MYVSTYAYFNAFIIAISSLISCERVIFAVHVCYLRNSARLSDSKTDKTDVVIMTYIHTYIHTYKNMHIKLAKSSVIKCG